jgi:hypothetical protein
VESVKEGGNTCSREENASGLVPWPAVISSQPVTDEYQNELDFSQGSFTTELTIQHELCAAELPI